MQTWTWWPQGPLELREAERLLELLVDARDWDGLGGVARCLLEMFGERGPALRCAVGHLGAPRFHRGLPLSRHWACLP